MFEPHPREFFQPDKPHFRLTPLPRKLALLERLGLDLAVVLRFDAALAGLAAEAFIDARAGAGARRGPRGGRLRLPLRQGPCAAIPRCCGGPAAAHGFGVTVVAQVAEAGEVFSSSAIRAELAQGDVAGRGRDAGPLVARGRHGGGRRQARHRASAIPTANLVLPPGTALAHGIYAVRVYVDGRRLDGAAYLGTRPTFDDGEPVLEVFLLDFDGDLYGREIEVEFIDFVRADAKFASAAALQEQMAKDCARARADAGGGAGSTCRSDDGG